jgi:CRISPR type IV-associated protein Csf2
METLIYEGTMTALSSISHNGGQSQGIESKLRRERFVQPDGSVEEVPLLSGNGLRGRLRDLGMWRMCRELGYSDNALGLSLAAFYFLFSGGALSGGGGQGFDIDRARLIRQLIPLASVFGGAAGNQIMPGKLKVGKAIPICAETRHLLPVSFQDRHPAAPSVWDYLQTEMYTRKDDERNEWLRGALEAGPAVSALLETSALTGQAALKRAAAAGAADAQRPQQMMYFVETFAAGAQFYWKLVLEDLTPVEYDAFMTCLAEFSKAPYVGGKSAVGLGEVAVKFDNWRVIDSRLQTDGAALTRPVGDAYAAHLRDNAPAIREMLNSL